MAYPVNSSTYNPFSGVRLPKWATYFRSRLVYHLVFWLILYCYSTIYTGFIIKDYTYAFFDFTVKLPFIIGICYFNIYYLLPAFMTRRRYITYLIALFFSILLPTILLQIILNKLVYFNLCPRQYLDNASFSYENTLEKMFSITTIVLFTCGLKLSKNWVTQQQKIAEIESRQLQTELQFLKLQISPHFFFNTLNNLYALVLKKSDQAPDVVLKFSDMVSYLLYESDTEKASLKKEIEVIENYLSLEELRFGTRVTIDFKLNGNPDNFDLPPLILLPIVENCFKHGTMNFFEHVDIRIHLSIENNLLHISTSNPVAVKTIQSDKIGGVGLKNLQRRLELIYGKAFELKIEEQQHQFTVSLIIPSV